MSRSSCAIAITLALSVLSIVACAPTATDNAPFARPKPYELHNPDAGFDFLVWSESKTPLIIGGHLRLKLRATTDAYLNLYAIDTSYDTRQLLTNHSLPANETVTLGGHRSPLNYRVTPPPGTETYIAVATRTPLQWLEPTDIRHGQSRPELILNAGQLIRRLQQALDALPAAEWNATVLDRRIEWPRKSSFPKVM